MWNWLDCDDFYRRTTYTFTGMSLGNKKARVIIWPDGEIEYVHGEHPETN